jgi:hydroxymethylpyrimidine pyrophosphatase-like HAD family hydrolase
MPFDAIISDIDGCLGPEHHGPLDASALARIAAWNLASGARSGPALTLCSGRPQPYAEAMSRLVANTRCPIVCEMGVWLYDPRDNRFLIDPAITDDDLARLDDCTRWIRREYIPRGVVIQPGKAASISLWHADTAWLMSIKARLVEEIARRNWKMRVASTVAWINLELDHVSKGTGIDRLCAMMGYRKDRLAGIGDTLGDMAIRERVAFFACPSNADERLKEVADYVSPHAEVEGVLDVLRRVWSVE